MGLTLPVDLTHLISCRAGCEMAAVSKLIGDGEGNNMGRTQ